MNGGKFDGGLLTSSEKEIDQFYQQLFKKVHSSEAIQQGAFFDLQYAQDSNYDAKKLYAYLRYTSNEKLLIVTNFDAKQGHDINLQIPALALDMMQVKSFKLAKNTYFTPPSTSDAPRLTGNKIYIPANSPCDPKWWRIGVRIEDDILITKTGYELLSTKTPRKMQDIEKLMKEKSVLDTFILPDLSKQN
jgi:hypothetical protein